MISTMLTTCLIWLPVVFTLLFALRFYLRSRAKGLLPELRVPKSGQEKPFVVGFFHPYCNAGGGGERVLWVAIRALQNRYRNFRCVIYTGDTDATREEILQRAQQRFNIVLPRTDKSDLQFIFLYKRQCVEASPYPILTLLGQSMGSLVLGLEALLKYIPDIYVDSMGYAFTIPLFKYIGGCKVGCYVHYPTISTDMLHKVSDRSSSFNNSSVISRSPILSRLKVFYYKIFAYMYGIAGKRSDFVMVNSSWTYGHISELWGNADHTNIVYPPCDVQEFLTISVDNSEKELSIVSIGQFRPEKDHALQIKSFAAFLEMVEAREKSKYKLILVGGCRNDADQSRVKNLKALSSDLKIDKFVNFKLNVSFAELKQTLAKATIGIHTMWNEHFGIGVVESMAAGVVMLAHDSGGPKLDIVKPYNEQITGFLASDIKSYSNAMKEIFDLSLDDRDNIVRNARESVARFSDNEFESGFLDSIANVLTQN